ncbi:MAG: plasmid pRiA4b ORF-3 family protein [Bacteroidales bacterium]|nr:plasmid pRiA4b ORF-3 family protein [Bacteroidales bacterium]
MSRRKPPEEYVTIKLTLAQRKTLAEMMPTLADRLKLDEQGQRTIEFTETELRSIKTQTDTAVTAAMSGVARNSLRHITHAAQVALERPQGQVYQLKITLVDTKPPIWRRIQVKDCTLAKLHESIQTAMGWTNSHLHHFRVGEQLYGDPELMQENFAEMGYKDSTTTKISDILPKKEKTFRFEYEYDFGDGWLHEVLVEGVVGADPKTKYPLCLEGKRACPPEDCGGVWGYPDFLEAIQNPDHEQHEEMLEWIGGRFDPKAFDAAKATEAMRKGLSNWRE